MPRRTGLPKAGAFILLAIAGAFFVVNLIIAAMFYTSAYKNAVLKDRGIVKTGTVTDKYGKRGRGAGYYFNYSFEISPDRAANSVKYYGSNRVGVDEFATFSVGSPVPVIYDPRDAWNSALNLNDQVHQRDPYSLANLVVAVSGLASVFILAAGTAYPLYRYGRDRRLLRYGTATAATITGKRTIWTGQRETTTLAYEFTGATGERGFGECKGLPTQSWPGTTHYLSSATLNPTVVYDPRDPRRNLLYPSQWAACLPSDDGR